MEALQQLYTDYLAEVVEVRRNAPRFAGIFGLGEDPRKHPCHTIFYNNVEKWVEEFLAAKPSRDAALETAWFFLEAPKKHEETESYWFMYVCIGFIRKLIPYLTAADCKALAERFNALYPRRDRMPVQQETFKMLQKASK